MRYPRPVLLDHLIVAAQGHVMKVGDKGEWYIAKPPELKLLGRFWRRTYHAWLVLTGRARAFQYFEDARDDR